MADPSVARRKEARRERRAELLTFRRREALKRRFVVVAVLVPLLALAAWTIARIAGAQSFPPTGTFARHPETFPSEQIMEEPIDDAVQSHVMEHGSHRPGAKPGVIVSYNCEKFTCEPDLVDRLKAIVSGHSEGVYLAPYPRMDGKIALTTRGRLEVRNAIKE